MSSSKPQQTQTHLSPTPQPRGLPGFLRRTLRNPYEDGIADSPSSAPGTPVLPGLFSRLGYGGNDVNDGDDVEEQNDIVEEAENGEEDDVKDSQDPKSGGGASFVNADKDEVENKKMSENRPVESSTETKSGSGGVGTSSSNKPLRKVAFPHLPFTSGDGDDPEEEGQNKRKNDESQNISNGSRNMTNQRAMSESSILSPKAQTSSTNRSSYISSASSRNVNSASTTPNPSSQPPTDESAPPKSYKEIQFETIISSPIIPIRDLRKLAWNGIPPHHRGLSWKILLGYLPANTSRHTSTLDRKRSEYKDAIKQHYDIPDDSRTNSEQETLRQVLVDVPRTAPEVPLFHNDRVRRCLSRLLYIWAMRHPASSYVQGINDLATPFIAVFLSDFFGGIDCLNGEIMANVTDEMLEKVEADTYWCLTNLLAGIQDHYTSDQPGMQRMVMRLEELVNRIDAELCTHLKNTGIEFIQFAFKWMNCLLLREFSLSCVLRLWDTYLSEGDRGFEDFHVYVCASFLVHFSAELQQMSFDELFCFMQNMPTGDWGDREVEILLSSAFVLSTLFGGSEAHLNVVRKN